MRGSSPVPSSCSASRRDLLVAGAAGFAGLIAGPDFARAAECVLTSSQVEGPYFIPDAPERYDLRDGKAGTDLAVRLQVVDAATCDPIAHAFTEIWSCDALGSYSGHPDMDPSKRPNFGRAGQGPRPGFVGGMRKPTGPKRFLRGGRRADKEGKVEYLTLYPGWYAPRTVHVHVKIRLAEDELLTTQFYFPEDLNRTIHQQEPYAERFPSPYTNANDRVMRRGGTEPEGVWPTLTSDGDTQVATLTIGVQRS